MAQASTIQTVTVVRPLKVMALICCLISLVLMVISLGSTAWLEAEGYRQGLWQECKWEAEQEDMQCNTNPYKAWIIACAAMAIIALFIAAIATLLTGIGLGLKDYDRKLTFYRIAMCLMFFGVLCLIIALVVFPIMFLQEIERREQNEWYFAWAYGVAWGATIFIFGAAILLLIDKESGEIYYSEKRYYYETDA